MILRRTGAGTVRSKISGIHLHKQTPYLLLVRPPDLGDSRNVLELVCKVSGLPIMSFSCPVIMDGPHVMAARIPSKVYSLDCRAFPRIKPSEGSMATFFIKGGSRVSICMMADISMGGTRLVGKPNRNVMCNDIIGPCTLSLAGRDALITREITVDKATIVRLEEGNGRAGQLEMGVKFDLNEREKQHLKEHVDFLSGSLK